VLAVQRAQELACERNTDWSPLFPLEHRITTNRNTVGGICYYVSSSGLGHFQVSTPTFYVLLSGSGGVLCPDGLAYSLTTGGGRLTEDLCVAAPRGESVVSAQTMIAAVKERLRLNVKELAAVCAVERPTIYNWFSGVMPNAENLGRIRSLYELSKQLVGRPLERSELVGALANGETLIGLLSQKDLPTARIAAVLEQLGNTLHQGPASSTLANRLRRLGFSERSERDARLAMKRASRSYVGAED
jgi:predicted DNA-binding transcriptional regulator AlpA